MCLLMSIDDYSLHPKMIVLPPGVFYPKMIVRDQMFIDYVDVENFAKCAKQFLHQQNQ